VLADDILDINAVEDLSFDPLEIVQPNTIPLEAERSPHRDCTSLACDRRPVSQPCKN
jgi:hypothetical protein